MTEQRKRMQDKAEQVYQMLWDHRAMIARVAEAKSSDPVWSDLNAQAVIRMLAAATICDMALRSYDAVGK